MEIRDDRLYSESHEWVLFENDTTATVRLTDFAQSELGDLVFVNLPQVGESVVAGETFADVERVKAVSDVYCPVSGIVAAVNEALLDAPQTINQKPFEAWLVKIEHITDRSTLMDADAYRALTEK